MSIIVTTTPTLICGIANGVNLRVIVSSGSFIWMLTTTTCISICLVGKDAT